MAARKKRASSKKARRKGRKAGKRKITVEDLLRLHFLGDPQISPDGRTLVFTKRNFGPKNDQVTNLWSVSASGGAPRPFTNGGKDARPRWSRDGKRVAFIGEREKDHPQIFTIDADGGEATALTRFPEGKLSAFSWSPDGSVIGVSFREQDPDWTTQAQKEREAKGLSDPPRVLDDWWYRLDGDGYFNAQRYALYLVDTATGKHRKVFTKDNLGFFTFDFSPDSKQVVIAANPDRKAMLGALKCTLYRLNVKSGKFARIPNLPEGPKHAPRWSPDGKRIAYAGRTGEDDAYSVENLELFVCDAVKGKAKSLTGREDYCLLACALSDAAEIEFEPNLQWGADSKRIFVSIGWHGATQVASVAARGGKLQFHTSGATEHIMGNLSADGRSMALLAGSATKPHEVHVAQVRQKDFALTRLTNLNGPVLRGIDLARPRSHWVKSTDGARVQVWTLRPPGVTASRKVPAVLEVHGGPHAQYGVAFFHEFQLLAANGYAVFYSNPRGSKGYGRDHCAAIRGHWGDKDWEDIEAVTAFMKAQPYVNAKRMAIMGGSYGGYMTCWAIGHTRDFRAAISDRCVANLVSMFCNSDFVSAPDLYWEGNSWDRPEHLWRDSPLKYLGNARTPTLLIHSEGDLRCNVEQSEEVFAVLKLKGVPTRFVRYPRSTSHGMSRSGPEDMRLHRLREITGWLKKYLKA